MVASAEGRAESVTWESQCPGERLEVTSGRPEPSLDSGTHVCRVTARLFNGLKPRLPVCSNGREVRIRGCKQLAAVELGTQSGSSKSKCPFSSESGRV